MAVLIFGVLDLVSLAFIGFALVNLTLLVRTLVGHTCCCRSCSRCFYSSLVCYALDVLALLGLILVDFALFCPYTCWPHSFSLVLVGLALVKGTNGRQKTYEILHVYCIFYSGFRCQTTVIFGITKDGSLVLNTLAS